MPTKIIEQQVQKADLLRSGIEKQVWCFSQSSRRYRTSDYDCWNDNAFGWRRDPVREVDQNKQTSGESIFICSNPEMNGLNTIR